MSDDYKDIINLPHYESAKRQRMPMINRAAQFSPFAALSGHGEAIEETARLTDKAPDLDDNEKELINCKLQAVYENIKHEPVITVTYFEPDKKKQGGAYITKTARVTKLDTISREILFADSKKIRTDFITDIQCSFFSETE